MAQKQFVKRVDKNLYDEASKIYDDLGTNVESAFVMFLKKTIAVKGLPFDLKVENIPNDETIAAMSEDLSKAKRYSSFQDLLEDLDKD